MGESLRTARTSGAVESPELVLVDDESAAHLRSALPRPDDTIARVELLVRASRIAAARAPDLELDIAPSESASPARRTAPAGAESTSPARPTVLAPSESAPPARRTARQRARPTRPRRTRRNAMLAGGTVAAAFAVALLVEVPSGGHRHQASPDVPSIGAPPVVRTQPPVSTAATSKASKPRAAAKAPTKRAAPSPARQHSSSEPGRRFVWAPVSRASGYRVEFFRGSALVFAADTSRPEVTIPPSWMREGKRESLRAGDYQWYVWPLHGGLRAPVAVVQARLSVAAS